MYTHMNIHTREYNSEQVAWRFPSGDILLLSSHEVNQVLCMHVCKYVCMWDILLLSPHERNQVLCMYVRMYVCMPVCMLDILLLSPHEANQVLCMYVCMCVCMYVRYTAVVAPWAESGTVCMHVCMYARSHWELEFPKTSIFRVLWEFQLTAIIFTVSVPQCNFTMVRRVTRIRDVKRTFDACCLILSRRSALRIWWKCEGWYICLRTLPWGILLVSEAHNHMCLCFCVCVWACVTIYIYIYIYI
jgi:hypothetical protein